MLDVCSPPRLNAADCTHITALLLNWNVNNGCSQTVTKYGGLAFDARYHNCEVRNTYGIPTDIADECAVRPFAKGGR